MAPEHTGGMIALIPADQNALAVPGGDPAEEMHLTLAYLGDDVTSLPEAVSERLREEVGNLARQTPLAAGRIFAHAQWNVDGGPDGEFEPATVYELEDGGQFQVMHDMAAGLARETLGSALFPEQHYPFKPHVTAGYNLSPSLLTALGEVKFDRMRLALGDEVNDYPLGGPGMDALPLFSVTADAAAVAEVPVDNEVPVEFPVLIVEGMETADGRFIEAGALEHRALPLPILAQTRNPDGGTGHDGAEVIGRLDELTRRPGPQVTSKETGEPFPEGTFVWSGKGVIDGGSPGGKLAAKGYLTGNSADLSEVEAEFVWPEGAEDGLFTEPEQIRMTAGKIAATTLVPIPAFADAYVELDGATPARPQDAPAAVTAAAWRSADLGDECSPCAAFGDDALFVPQEKRDRADKAGHAMPGGRYPIENDADLDKAVKAVGRAKDPDGDDDEAERRKVRRHIIKQAKRLGSESKIPDNWNSDGSLKSENSADAITAAAALYPPLAAFTDPGLTEPTPLTLDDESLPGELVEVFGHLAVWGTCHTSFASSCVTPPRSYADYAYFNVGGVRALDGEQVREVAVGHITMGGGGHARMGLNAAEATAHYDNTNAVLADVAAGEDEHGVWVHGVLRRGVTEAERETLRSSPLSGDWRTVNGHLELVAALAVNVPGYPVPRARVASGGPVALVAAGALPVGERKAVAEATDAELDKLADRIAERLRVKDDEDQATFLAEFEKAERQLGLRRRAAAVKLRM